MLPNSATLAVKKQIAAQFDLPGDVPFSGAALAANGVLILVFLVTAVALFERQGI